MIKRVYDTTDKQDGYRILVDRLWPRGVTKENAKIDLWLKEVGPTAELRKWFGHEPGKWEGFLARYKEELATSEAYDQLKSLINQQKIVTLVYSAKDTMHNNAAALLVYLKT